MVGKGLLRVSDAKMVTYTVAVMSDALSLLFHILLQPLTLFLLLPLLCLFVSASLPPLRPFFEAITSPSLPLISMQSIKQGNKERQV